MIFDFHFQKGEKMTKSKKHNPKGKKRNKKSEKAPSFVLDSKMTPEACAAIGLEKLQDMVTNALEYLPVEIRGKKFEKPLDKVLEVFLIIYAAKQTGQTNEAIKNIGLFRKTFLMRLKALDNNLGENFLLKYYPRVLFKNMLAQHIESHFGQNMRSNNFLHLLSLAKKSFNSSLLKRVRLSEFQTPQLRGFFL